SIPPSIRCSGRCDAPWRRTSPLLASARPDVIRVAGGGPPKSALPAKPRRIGEAWSAKCSADGTCETFLSPCLADPVQVGAVLVHELVHHAVGVEHGHKGPFRKLAVAIGLTGPMRATSAGPALAERLHTIAP